MVSKKISTFNTVLLLLFSFMLQAAALESGNNILFNSGWLFHRGTAEGGETPKFNDSGWRKIDLPHDYSNEDVAKAFPNHKPKKGEVFEGPVSTALSGGQEKTGYAVGGEAWYRKHFDIPAALKGKVFIIKFGGIYMNADIWVNGHHLGIHHYGYSPFFYNITDSINYGGKNVIAVRVRNMGKNCRWYSGSGIYRHVKLDILNPVHIAEWGTYITTPKIGTDSALVNVKTKISNSSGEKKKVQVKCSVLDKTGKTLASGENATEIKSGAGGTINTAITLQKPCLWSPDSPELYYLKTEVTADGKTTDKSITPFGIRKLEFSVDKGFLMNGKPILLKGGCMHHDNGCLGSIGLDRAEERRVEIMKKNGFNAIRCAHNPPTEAFLNACDRLGMMVIDEAFDQWRTAKTEKDYHLYFDKSWKEDLAAMILRDKNHPSIIMWSIGNEIKDIRKAAGAKLAGELAKFARTLDPTRPITMGVNRIRLGKGLDPAFAALDVSGYNYGTSSYEKDHQRVPKRIMFASESYLSKAYDNWEKVKELPYVIGDFVWAGFDYRGEVGIGWQLKQVWTGAYCGDIDLLGDRMPSMSLREIVWNPKTPKVAVFAESPVPLFKCGGPTSKWAFKKDLRKSWNFKNGETIKVQVFSNCPVVKLFIGGKEAGSHTFDKKDQYAFEFETKYSPGTLRAVGYDADGKELTSDKLVTTSAPAAVKLLPDRKVLNSTGKDLCFVKADIVDSEGRRCQEATNLVKFEVEGPGKIIAVGNADASSLESNLDTKRKAFQGRCMAVIETTGGNGVIKVKAVSKGLTSTEVNLKVQ